MPEKFVHESRVAYFSMEIALESSIPTYSGGLGILAGDTLRAAADLALPMVAVTLVSRGGYFRQQIDAQGRQLELEDAWDPAAHARPLESKVAVPIERRDVWVAAWLYELRSAMGAPQPVVLLDTDLPENADADRRITHTLYGGDDVYRLEQEIVLGVGGMRMLRALGFRLRHYHMNEGHSALLALELLRQNQLPADELRAGESPYDLPRVRAKCSFTTHTPVEAGHDRFGYDLVQRLLGDMVDAPTLRALGGPQQLNMTRLALNLSEHVNGVAKRHAEVSRRMFPGYRVSAITNGVHPQTWTAPPLQALYDLHLPGWRHEPELLVRADALLSDDALVAAHRAAKQALIARVQERTGVALRADVALIGFARRMTSYKRPDLLFTDLERLLGIARRQPLQLVLAGKAHPHDAEGKRLIELIHGHARQLGAELPVVFVPNYDFELAQHFVGGADVWLNTPQPPMEASGTSGMKAAYNGVPHLSVLDGWWAEGCIEGVTGWAVGDGHDGGRSDANSLYDKLEQQVLPLYYGAPAAWAALMKGVISKNASVFSSHRMMRRYATEAYLE